MHKEDPIEYTSSPTNQSNYPVFNATPLLAHLIICCPSFVWLYTFHSVKYSSNTWTNFNRKLHKALLSVCGNTFL